MVEIELPPLRDRLEDVPLLIDEFLNFFNQKNNKNIEGLTQRCQFELMRYQWPGNVRELKNVIERAVILSRASKIDIEALPERIIAASHKIKIDVSARDKQFVVTGEENKLVITIPIGTKFEEVEK